VIRPKIASEHGLQFAADHADDGETRHLREVDQGIAHPTGGGMDEHALALLRPHRIVENMVGHLVIGERRCGVKVDVIGDKKGRGCRSYYELRVVAATMWPLACVGVDALAGPSGSDRVADFLDRARELLAWGSRKRWHEIVRTGADQNIGHAHANSTRADQDFIRFGLWNGHIEASQHARRTRLAELDELHHQSFLQRARTMPLRRDEIDKGHRLIWSP
jgi:hypothetical protein